MKYPGTEAKYEINVQFLAFSVQNLVKEQSLDGIFWWKDTINKITKIQWGGGFEPHNLPHPSWFASKSKSTAG